MWSLVSHVNGRTQEDDIQEQVLKKSFWPKTETWRRGCISQIAYWVAAPFVLHDRYLSTNPMRHGASCESNRSSSRQEIPHLLWKGKVHYRIYKGCPTVPILSHINVVPPPPQSRFLKKHFNVILSSRYRSSTWSPSLRLPCQNPECTSPVPHKPTCHMPFPSYFSRAKYYVVQR